MIGNAMLKTIPKSEASLSLLLIVDISNTRDSVYAKNIIILTRSWMGRKISPLMANKVTSETRIISKK